MDLEDGLSSMTPALPAELPRRLLGHLRIYESSQILVAGLFGIAAAGSLPPLPVVALYVLAHATHLLSVYSYNDYCDLEADSHNPRKASAPPKSARWLRNQTLALTAVFLASASLLPLPVGLLLLANQIVCMAYSDPRFRLKAKPFGSEAAHFFAGFTYVLTGALVAGGRAGQHWREALLFGLLYLSGGTFNEILDRAADEAAGIRHLVVRIGSRRALRLVFAIHAAAFAMVVATDPSPFVLTAVAAGILVYGTAALPAARDLSGLRLLGFRRRYRMVFALLLVVLVASRV
jgi:4-hydroxybenzoate polyprenyltransferase